MQTTVQLFRKDSVREQFEKLLGAKSQGFISSVLQVATNNNLLEKADPMTILNAALTAAALDLPINQSLGYSYIVPFNGKAQFQIGWKGYVQLAQRTGQYKAINVVEVYENQFQSFNAMTEELNADFTLDGTGKAVGYIGYFKLLNGYEKTVYWSRAKVESHAKKYSQSYKKGYGVWADGEDGFTAMAKKTVLKLMLSQWGIMTIEMQTAQLADQSVIAKEGQYHYADNVENQTDLNDAEETKRINGFLDKCDSVDDVEVLESTLADETISEKAKEAIEQKKLAFN